MKVVMRSGPPDIVQFLRDRLPSDCHLHMVSAESLPEEVADADVLIPGHIMVTSSLLERPIG